MWQFFGGEKPPSKNHVVTSNPPQIHHKKPSQNHPISQKAPEKTPLRHVRKNLQN
jgi:hypothetical protein